MSGPHIRRLVIGAAVLSCTSGSVGAQSATVALTSQTCPVCTMAQMLTRLSQELFSLGMAGSDVLGHHVGAGPAGTKLWPVIPEKTKFCGTLHTITHSWPSDSDHDWKLNIVPVAGSPSAALFDLAKKDAVKSHIACARDNCMHAEFNLDQSFPEINELFQANVADLDSDWQGGGDPPIASGVTGRVVCVYGAMVTDRAKGHGNKPEIHPAELIWWKEARPDSTMKLWKFTSRVNTYLWFNQDDSERYDYLEDFPLSMALAVVDALCSMGLPCSAAIQALAESAPRPWAGAPRRSEARLQFQADGSGAKLRSYTISELRSRLVTTSSDAGARADEGPGTDYHIELDGIPILHLKELQPDDNLGVRFENICRLPGTNQIVGQIVLNTRYGTDGNGGEGYQSLLISQADFERPAHVVRPAVANARAMRAWADSAVQVHAASRPPRDSTARPPRWRVQYAGPVRRIGSSLAADLATDAESDGTGAIAIAKAAIRTERERRALPIDAGSQPPGGQGSRRLVRDIPITSRGTLELELTDGRTRRLAIPALMLAPARRSARVSETRGENALWPTFVRAAGGRRPAGAPPGELQHVAEWTVDFAPRYAAREAGEGGDEDIDDSRLARLVNAAVDSAASDSTATRTTRLFGTTRPFSSSWSFRAVDLATNRPVAVGLGGRARPGQIAVDPGPTASSRIGYTIRFPRDGKLYRVDATARIEDSYGIRGTVQHSVWSHYLRATIDSGAATLVNSLARLGDVDAARDARPAAPDAIAVAADQVVAAPASNAQFARRVHAAAARTWAIQALINARLTFPELQLLLRAASPPRMD